MVEQVALEQLMMGLLKGTSDWFWCQQPTSLEAAIALAENHLSLREDTGRKNPLPCPLPLPCPPALSLSLFTGTGFNPTLGPHFSKVPSLSHQTPEPQH